MTRRPGAVRLGIVYLASFAVTTLVVLGGWASTRADRPLPAPPPPPEIRRVEALVEVPVPAPEPVVEEIPPEEIPPPEEFLPPEPEAEPEPPSALKPAPRPTPRPAPVKAPVAAAAEPAPVAAAPQPAPKPQPPAPVVPPEVQALAGTYNGKAKGDPLSITFTFGPDGKLSGRVARDGGPSLAAAGTYQLTGGTVSFVLLEASGTERIAFSGTLSASGGAGRMAVKGQDIGKFSVSR